MLKGYKILTSFCVICATLCGGAYGAASVRGGATSRAGSIRTLGAGTTASVKATSAKNQSVPTVGTSGDVVVADNPRVASLGGLGGTKLTNSRLSTPTVPTSNQNVVELQQAIEQLRNDYDALGEQYNNLLGDVSNVSDTAQVAHETATNNTNTLTVVRGDLSVAKSDIEDLKATGGFDEERVQEVLDTTLAQRNYATRGELATTDAVARGAVQVADLPQTLNALNIADKDYVASRTQGVVNDSLNITLENYYTKKQVNDAIDVAKIGMVDKNYVDNQIDGLAAKTYVDNRVASIQTGVSEGAVQGIINNSIDTRLGNYYTKGDIDNAIVDAIGAAKDGMADRDYVDNQVRDLASTEYVNEKVAEIESGVDAGTLYNILETRGYKTGTEVQGIVNDSINNTVANYYTKGQVDNAINVAKNGMADRNYVDNQIDGLAPKNWVNTVVDTKVNALPLGLDRNAVKAVVEEYGYKDEAGVQEMINASGHVKTSELPDLVKQWAPGAEIQYADGKLYFVDKDGNDRVVDIRGLDGQDGDQVELQRNGDAIVWRYVSGDDQSWHNLVNMSDLRGADGKSVELGLMNNNLVWKKEGESGWQYLYDLGSITGTDGCGVKAETTNTANGMMVKLQKDCAGQTGDGQLLTQFEVLNGADGTVSEEQIIDALESNPTFMQLKKNVQDLSDGLNNTNSLVNELSDRVDNNTTGVSATNTLANNAWNKVKDLESSNKTAREYVDAAIGDLGFDLLTRSNYASVAAKLGAIDDTKTVAEYINAQISKINTSIQVERGDDGVTYICKTGNNCTTNPNPYTGDWTRISVDVSGYLTRAEADDSFAPIGIVGAVTTAQDAASQAQTQASQAWGKLSDLGGDTVKGYVDNTINGRVGFLGVNLFNGKDYSVADKLGFTATPGTVKEYIDKAVSSVNTKIQVAQYNGQTYICKKGDSCTTPAGPYYPEDWAQITVDVSGYLTENDANKLYAPIGTITIANDAKTIANEAKTAATAAQTSATQAQNVASAAQSKADDAWSKLNGLSGTVKEYVDDKVGSAGSTINVQTVNGVTYICRTGTCLDTPPSAYWAPIEVNISDEYLTEAEGDARYAPRAEYALKSEIGALGGSFTNVGAKIGLNDYQYGNTTVKDYVDNKVSNISTTIQVETGTDGFTYICKNGNNCHLPIATYPSEWAKVNVDLGNLGTNSYGQSYNVAQKIGLTDSTNINKTVVGYIGDQIGELGNYYDATTYGYRPYNVKKYLEDTYVPKTTVGDLGSNGGTNYTVAQKIGLDTADTKNTTVKMYVDNRVGNLGVYWDSSSYQNVPYTSVKQYVDDKFAFKVNIGTLGGDFTNVGDKIGLNSTNDTTNSAKTVKQYIDGLIGNLGGSFTSVAGKLGDAIGANQTVVDYVQNYVAANTTSINVKPGNDGYTYICTGSNCTSHASDPENDSTNWTKLNVNLSYIDNILAGFGSGEDKIPTVKGYVDTSIGALGKTNDLTNASSVAAKLGTDITSANKTVAQYVGDKIGSLGSYNNGTYDVYYNVATKIGAIDSSQTVKGYVDAGIGSLGSGFASVASKLGAVPNDQTVTEYIAAQLATVSTSIVVKSGTDGNTYICTGTDCATHANDPNNDPTNWTKLNVDLSGINAILAGFGKTGEPPTVMNYIGEMGGYYDTANYGVYTPYTVATKIGLNTDDTKNKTVKQYIDGIVSGLATTGYVDTSIGSLGKTNDSTDASSVADKLGTAITGANKTVAKYIEDYVAANAASGGVTVKTVGNDTYICSENCENDPPCKANDTPDTCGWQKLEVDLSQYLKSSDAASTYLPRTNLKLVRDGADIRLKRVVGDDITDYGIVAGVQDLMCRSYRTETVEPGVDGCPASGSACYKMICNTNGND